MLITFIISITSVVLQVTSEPRLESVWISWFTHAFTPQVLIDAYCISGPRDTGLNKTEHDVTFMSLPALTFFSPAGAGQRQNWAVGEIFYRTSFPLTPVLFLSTHNPCTAQIDQNTPNGYALRLSPSRDNVLSLVHGSQGENFWPSQRAICLRRASLFFTSTKSNSLVEDVSRPLLALECDNYFRNTVSFLSSV